MIMKQLGKQLGKWLGVGNSFFGGNQAVAYRLNKIALPKFNAGKNPFLPKDPDDAPAAPKVENRISAPANKLVAPVAPAAVAKSFVPAKRAPMPAPPAKPSRSSWTARLNPFRAPEPAPQPAAVQPELSLDSVKVVHNDLADADVDIVPVKSHVAEPEVPMLPPARRAWEFLGESAVK